MLELIRGPRTRVSLVSAGNMVAVTNGRTKTTGVGPALYTEPEAARSKSRARRTALVEAYVGVMVG